MKKLIIFFLFCIISFNVSSLANILEKKDLRINTNIFSITLPKQVRGTYKVKKEKNKICIYHKESKKRGFGGFAFGIKAYKNPSEHAVLPGSQKIGELTDKKGVLYDIVLKRPTDVQYDYPKSSIAPKEYKELYDAANSIVITGINGAVYFKNKGMKGQDLYKEVLEKHIRAIKERWDSTKLEKENMSYMYNVLAQTNKNVLDKIGYAYYDVNADGIDELLIGEITTGPFKGVIYDIYTMVDREPRHVISGGNRDRYYVCDDSFICRESSLGALEYIINIYNLVENSTELFLQVSFKYDGYTNPQNAYSISYSDEKWNNVDKITFNERKKVFEKYERFNFIPLSKFIHSESIKNNTNAAKILKDNCVIIPKFQKNYFDTTFIREDSIENSLIITDDVSSYKLKQELFHHFPSTAFMYQLYKEKNNKPFSYIKYPIYYK